MRLCCCCYCRCSGHSRGHGGAQCTASGCLRRTTPAVMIGDCSSAVVTRGAADRVSGEPAPEQKQALGVGAHVHSVPELSSKQSERCPKRSIRCATWSPRMRRLRSPRYVAPRPVSWHPSTGSSPDRPFSTPVALRTIRGRWSAAGDSGDHDMTRCLQVEDLALRMASTSGIAVRDRSGFFSTTKDCFSGTGTVAVVGTCCVRVRVCASRATCRFSSERDRCHGSWEASERGRWERVRTDMSPVMWGTAR